MSYVTSAHALSSLSPEARHLLTSGARLEQMASDILAYKRMMVELDRQRQECVQALAVLRDKPQAAASSAAASSSASASVLPSSLHAPPPSHLWVSVSGNFARFPRPSVRSALEADRARLDGEIARVRAEMKEVMKSMQSLAPAGGIDVTKGTLDFALST